VILLFSSPFFLKNTHQLVFSNKKKTAYWCADPFALLVPPIDEWTRHTLDVTTTSRFTILYPQPCDTFMKKVDPLPDR
jgi:hypothetical protein